MIIRFKKLNNEAPTPTYSKEGDAAVDLTATSMFTDSSGNLCYGTGIAVEIPKGYVGLVYPRSSLSKYNLILANHVGVIDSNYRGEIILRFKLESSNFNKNVFNVGNRIAQLIIQPIPEMSFVEVSELTPTNRGSAGFGSSGV